jgi:hypothetical protein
MVRIKVAKPAWMSATPIFAKMAVAAANAADKTTQICRKTNIGGIEVPSARPSSMAKSKIGRRV